MWWSVVGLLSSSCCALQLILNAMSIGCAGFNTFLGPLRPGLMAVSLCLQASMWSVAYSRPWQWPVVGGSSALTLVLTLLPEAVDLWTRHISTAPRRSTEATESKAEEVTGRLWEVTLALEGVGCVACVQSVTAALMKGEGEERVRGCRVSIEEATATLQVLSEAKPACTKIVDLLGNIGFPATLQSCELKEEGSRASSDAKEAPISHAEDSCCSGGTEASEVATGSSSKDKDSPLSLQLLSTVAGLLSSSCCLLQLAINLLSMLDIVHIGCAGFNKVLGPWRTELRSLTGLWLLGLWVLLWRRGWPRQLLRQVLFSTVLSVTLAFLPEILLLAGAPAIAPPLESDNTELLEFRVDGMGCEACQTHVQSMVTFTSGVLQSHVDLATGQLSVLIAKDWKFDATELGTRLAKAGFELLLPTPPAATG